MAGREPPRPLMRNPSLANVLPVAGRGNHQQFEHFSISKLLLRGRSSSI